MHNESGKKTISIRKLVLGEGRPKIVAPIAGYTVKEVLQQAKVVRRARPDAVEWRADYFSQTEDLVQALYALRQVLVDMPLLFTYGTNSENDSTYIKSNRAAVHSGCVDMLDVRFDSASASEQIAYAKARGVAVILSSHDQQSTPSAAQLRVLFAQMQALGADIIKIAVTAQSAHDVNTLLQTAEKMKAQQTPFIAISMGALGVISRLCTCGSCLCFAHAGKLTAPGQLSVRLTRELFDEIYGSVKPV